MAYYGYDGNYRRDLALPQMDVYRYKGVYELDEEGQPYSLGAAMGVIGGIGPGTLVRPVPEPYGTKPSPEHTPLSAYVCMSGQVAAYFVREEI